MTFTFRRSLAFILLYAYAYILMPTTWPGDAWTATALGLVFVPLCHWVFKQQTFEVNVTRIDLQLGALFCGALCVFHWPILFAPLSNDEPHHAERALWLMKAAFNWTADPSAPPYQSLRESWWKLLSFRAMPAIEVWRVITIGFGLYCGVIFWVWRKIKTEKGPLHADLIIVLALGAVTVTMFRWYDNHPPLRTLLPFLSSVVFGLNDFAFRFSSILATSLFMLWFVRKLSPQLGLSSAVALAFLAILPPSIFHTTVLLEPSVYGFFGWSIILITLFEAFTENNDRKIVVAALLIPVFAMMRLPVFLLVIPVGIAMLLRPRVLNRRTFAELSVGAFLALGYAFAVAVLGNSAAAKTVSLNVMQIFTDGRPLVSWIRNWGFPWIAAFILAFALFLRTPGKVRLLALFFPLMIVAYHLTISPDTWGMGRYQAEYIGGFWCLFLFGAGLSLSKFRYKTAALATAALLCGIFTLEQINRIGSDNYATNSHSSFISNMSVFPYRRAIEYVQRHDANVDFLILGGVPSSYESSLWFSGYPMHEARVWYLLMLEFASFMKLNPHLEALNQYLKVRNIKYLIVQTGRRHERLSRAAALLSVFDKIEVGDYAPLKLDLVQTYEETWGGILKIYRVL